MKIRKSSAAFAMCAAAATAASLLAGPAAPAAAAAQQTGPSPRTPRYRVALAPKVILPPEQSKVGSEITVRRGEIFLRARLGWLRAATVEEDVTLAVRGRAEQLARGTILLAAVATGGDLHILPEGTRYFCVGGEFCLADSDGDERFERAFPLGGSSADRRLVDIQPVRYVAQDGMPMRGESEIRLGYRSGTNFRFEVIENGRQQRFGRIAIPMGPQSTMHFERTLRTRQPPASTRAVSAEITLLSVDPATGTARVRIDHDFRFSPYALIQGPQTIYIYVPG